jgi:OFA family oxalate/formate antiporter-like MFS transporter
MLCNGGGFSTMPAFVATCFGSRHVGQVYGLLLTAWGTAAIAGPLLLATLFDATRHYGLALHIFAVALVAGACIPLVMRRPTPVRQGAPPPGPAARQSGVTGRLYGSPRAWKDPA